MNRMPEEELEKAREGPDGAAPNGGPGAAASGAGGGARAAQGDAPGGSEPASGDSPESGAKEDEPQSLVQEIKEDIKEGIEHVKEEIQEGIEHVREEIQEGIEHVQEGIEQVREEIGQVVEHVPKPVRWGVKRIFWAVALSFGALLALLIVTAILYVANRTEWAASELTLLINQTLARRSDVEFEIRDIKGNPFTGVRLLDASVRFREGDQPPLLAAQVIRVNYSALRLLRGHGAITLDIEQPVVRLGYGDDGRLRMPRWKSEPRAKPSAGGRGFDLRVRIARGSLRLPRPMEGIEQLTLDARLETAGPARATIERLSWARGPWGSVLQNLRAEITDGDSVRCLVRELETGDVELRGHAAWKRGGSERVIAVNVDRVRWAWLARVFKNGVLDVPGEGRFLAHAVGGEHWRGDFGGSFSWNGLDLDGHGRFEGGRNGWTVEPLTARSKAGDLTGRFVYDPASWEVRGDVRHGQPRLWEALRLPGWPTGDLNGWFRYAVAAKGPDEMEARLVGSDLAGWHVDSARVWMWFPDDVPDSFRVVASRRGGESTLDAVLFPGGWGGRYRIARMPLDEWPDGRASGLTGLLTKGEGTVEARHGELYVGGALEGVSTDWLGARMEGWRLDGVAGRLLPAPDLECRATLGSTTFLGVHFDSAAAGIGLGDRAMEIADLVANAGDTLLTAAGRAAWGTDQWSITFDRAAAHSDQFAWTAEPPLAISGDPRGVVFDRMAIRDRGSRLDFSGRWAGPGGTYSFRARGDRLDLSRLGLPLGWGIEGVTDVTLAVDGQYGAPRWHMDGSANRLGARGQRADSVALEIGGGAGRLEVQNLRLTLADGAVEARGRVERAASPWPDTLTAQGVTEWLADAAFWEGTARATSLPLERVQGMLSPASGWGGRLDATLEVGGSPKRPTVAVRTQAIPLSWRDYRVDQVRARAEYRDGRLRVDQIQVARGGVSSSASGEVPMRLRLGAKPEFPDEPMAFKADIPSGDLSVFPLFVPQLGSASGHFDLTARAGGTARRPLLSGRARVRGGVVRLAGREEELRGLDADFRLDPSGIHLDSLRARQGDRGWVTGAGIVKLKGLALDGYRFDLVLRDFTAQETGLYAAEFDGRFEVTNGERVRGQTLPHVSGTVEMRHAVILLDFANQTETERLAATTQPLFWTYRVQVNATSNLHWQPPDGDIDFSADLMLEQTPDSLIVYGDMRALRGTYYFLSNRFSVIKADLTFDNLEGVNPLLDIEATTRVKLPAGTNCVSVRAEATATESNGPQEITATITGRSDEPVVSLSSSGDWDQQCILRQLTWGRILDEGGGVTGDPLDSYVTQAINRTLSAEMSRTFKGYINEWVLERERGGLLTGEGNVFVGVGVPVNRNLQIRYRQRVPGLEREYGTAGKPEDPFERNVEAEYRLNRFFFVTTELKQRRILSGSSGSVVSTPDFNVNLKARWEY